MTKRTLMTTAGAAALALAVATGVQAQQAAPDAKTDQHMSGQGSGGMGQGMPMMGMMEQMNDMMANCNRMMQTAMDRKGDRPKGQDGEKPAPENRG